MLILEQESYPICELRLRCNAVQSEELNQSFRERDKIQYDIIVQLSGPIDCPDSENEDVMIQGESISLDNSPLCNSILNNSMSKAVNQSISRQDKSSL
jgi:hypothetical protein